MSITQKDFKDCKRSLRYYIGQLDALQTTMSQTKVELLDKKKTRAPYIVKNIQDNIKEMQQKIAICKNCISKLKK